MYRPCANNAERLATWIESVLDPARYDVDLESMLEIVPTLSSLNELERSTPILVRADLDVPIRNGIVEDASRLDSFRNTIEFCQNQGLKPVLFGHVGRKPQNTGAPIAEALTDLYKTRVHFVDDWFDENDKVVTVSCQAAIAEAKAGEIILLENTRKYSFECALWDIGLELVNSLVPDLDRITVQVCSTISRNYIFDASASSNPDWSSIVVPAYMDRAAISEDIVTEFRDHVVRARRSQALIFSGLKMDKLDDLERILNQGIVRLILVGGALAMALIKGKTAVGSLNAALSSTEFSQREARAYSITAERIQQARRILAIAAQRHVKVVLPVDFVLDDGSISEFIPADRLQMDVGPKTTSLFKAVLLEFLEQSEEEVIVYYNGVLGKFEDERFEQGTKQMITVLRMLTEAGAVTYVGGGEGLLALKKYGDESWVTHAFTSGGTILKAMSGRIISYLSSLAHFAREETQRNISGDPRGSR
jgi:phosphoglycerate kinase